MNEHQEFDHLKDTCPVARTISLDGERLTVGMHTNTWTVPTIFMMVGGLLPAALTLVLTTSMILAVGAAVVGALCGLGLAMYNSDPPDVAVCVITGRSLTMDGRVVPWSSVRDVRIVRSNGQDFVHLKVDDDGVYRMGNGLLPGATHWLYERLQRAKAEAEPLDPSEADEADLESLAALRRTDGPT